MVASAVTIDTGEWIYLDSNGVPHVVTNAQSFSMTLVDGGVAAVTYNVGPGETMTTTDGYVLEFIPRVSGHNIAANIHKLVDTVPSDGFHDKGGELDIRCTSTGRVQHWRVAVIKPSDTDFGSAGTMVKLILEDQFGNRMVLPSTGSGITVAQAA